MIILALLLTSAFGVFALLFFLVMAESLIRGHDLPTNGKTTKRICKIISEYSPQANSFYDLGCARGALATRIKKRFPRLSVFAIDKSSIRIACAKLRAFLLGADVRFLRENIFDVDLSNADIVYTYLWYDTMPLLEKKLHKELKRGALVITNTSHFPNWEPAEKVVTSPKVSTPPDFETLFLYRKG